MRAVTGRWIWGVSGVATAALLMVPAARLVGRSGAGYVSASPMGISAPAATRTFTVPQQVSAVDVDSYGAPVRIAAGAVSHVKVTEDFSYAGKGPNGTGAAGGMSTVTQAVSGGRLTLADPSCASGGGCEVSFTLTVPAGTAAAVLSGGGPVIVSGTAAPVSVNSDGGAVDASTLGGPLTAVTNAGPLVVDGLSGSLTASTGGGFADAQGLTSADVTVTTGGGPTVLSFGAAPRAVTVATEGGSARIGMPGGPYALTANSGGGLESVQVATSPAAGRTLTVTTAGGPLLIAPSVPGVARPVKGIFLPGAVGAGSVAPPPVVPPPAPPGP